MTFVKVTNLLLKINKCNLNFLFLTKWSIKEWLKESWTKPKALNRKYKCLKISNKSVCHKCTAHRTDTLLVRVGMARSALWEGRPALCVSTAVFTAAVSLLTRSSLQSHTWSQWWRGNISHTHISLSLSLFLNSFVPWLFNILQYITKSSDKVKQKDKKCLDMAWDHMTGMQGLRLHRVLLCPSDKLSENSPLTHFSSLVTLDTVPPPISCQQNTTTVSRKVLVDFGPEK